MVNFKHDYDKLKLAIFPTIRSRGYADKHGFKLGDEVEITSPGGSDKALFVDFQDIAIEDIPLSFLRFDTSPLPVKDIQQFVDTLNSFLPEGWGHNQLSTIKRIYWFRWQSVNRTKGDD